MTDVVEQRAHIEKAFAGVQLEDGVGLHESQGLDDYLTREECAALRAKDEKCDWRRIPVIDLYRCGSCLSFFDAKGMRFHLPQIMLYYLDAYYEEDERLRRDGLVRHMDPPDLHWSLTHVDRFEYYFSALDGKQIRCVIGFLEYVRDNAEEYSADVRAIEKALPVWRARLNALAEQQPYEI